MSLPIEYVLDLDSRPHASWSGDDPAGRSLAQFLEADLGFHRDFADRILAEGRRIVEAGDGHWTASGNVFSLALGPGETVLAPLPDNVSLEPVTLPTDGFLQAVDDWRTFVSELEIPPED